MAEGADETAELLAQTTDAAYQLLLAQAKLRLGFDRLEQALIHADQQLTARDKPNLGC